MALSEAAGIMSSLAVANNNDEPDYSLIRRSCSPPAASPTR